MNQSKLNSIKEINEYLDFLYEIKSEVTILLSVRDTPGNNLEQATIDRLHKLGFQSFSKELWRMYAGVLHKGNVIVDASGKNVEDAVHVEVNIEDKSVRLISAAWRNGNRASILVDGIDYACNRRGLNIVVYDMKTDMPIDSVFFDFHGEKHIFNRDKGIIKKKTWLTDGKIFEVCLVGFWYGSNYGSLLNGYATYRILRGLNINVCLFGKPNSGLDDPELNEGTHNKRFVKKIYPEEIMTPRMSFEDMYLLNNKTNIFISGSDQIWNYFVSFNGTMYLPFVSENKKRISFCSSFGDSNLNISDENKLFIKNHIIKYDSISVRDEFSKRIVFGNCGKESVVLQEPVFNIEKNEYYKLMKGTKFGEQESYILAYILDPSDEIFRVIDEIQKHIGNKVITIADGYFGIIESSWDDYSNKNNIPNLYRNMEMSDFLCAFSKAEYIITDSFHGTCFSIIFEKPFISFSNANRGKERFTDILSKVGLMDRLVMDVDSFKWEEKFLQQIQYNQINEIISEERKKAVEWLEQAINIEKKYNNVNRTIDHEDCVGCASCANICPTNAIKMDEDYYGYYTPQIDNSKCVDCGKCTNTCPSNILPPNDNRQPRLFEFKTSDENLLYASSSGGVFSLLSDVILKKNGVVCGAAWKEDFSVEHVIVDKYSDINKLRKSKYLQSYISETLFKKIEAFLKEGRYVLFSGCPCQVAGMRKYLDKKGEKNEKLLLVDLLCSNAPSKKIFNRYLKEDVPENLSEYEFRTKEYGKKTDCNTVTLTLTSGERIIRKGGAEDEYQRLYHSKTMCSKHCEKCKFQFFPRLGDITIGDFWGISEKDKEIDSSGGVSAVLVNNEKGKLFFDMISEKNIKIKKEVPIDWLNGNGNYRGNWAGKGRDAFYESILKNSFHESANIALKPNKGKYCNKGKNSIFYIDSDLHRFYYDNSVWEQHYINNYITLLVKPGQSKVGRYAVMNLKEELKKNEKYYFSIRFKIKSDSSVINFHIKDSGSGFFQVICSKDLSGVNNGNKWIEIDKEFIPKSSIFDEFMIDAFQVSGDNNYIAFDYIKLKKT